MRDSSIYSLARPLLCLAVIGSVGASITGCVDQSAPSGYPRPTLAQSLYQVRARPNAIVMAVHDTLSLQATPLNFRSESIDTAKLAPITFASQDSATVTIDAHGKMTALRATAAGPIWVVASWTVDGVTKHDTARVLVTDTRYPVESFHLQIVQYFGNGPTPPSDTLIPLKSGYYLTVFATASDGSFVSGINSTFETDPSKHLQDSVLTFGGSFGVVVNGGVLSDFWVYANSTMYGVPFRDSVKFTGVYSYFQQVNLSEDTTAHVISSDFSGTQILSRCAAISFNNLTSRTLDIAFSDPSHVGGCMPGDTLGNVVSLGPNQTASRTFPTSGTFTWTVQDSTGHPLKPTVTGAVQIK